MDNLPEGFNECVDELLELGLVEVCGVNENGDELLQITQAGKDYFLQAN